MYTYQQELEDIYDRAELFSYIPGSESPISIINFNKILPDVERQQLCVEFEDIQAIASLLIDRYNGILKASWANVSEKNSPAYPPYYDVCVLISAKTPPMVKIVLDQLLTSSSNLSMQTFDVIDISDSWGEASEITHLLFGRSDHIRLLNTVISRISAKATERNLSTNSFHISWHGFYPIINHNSHHSIAKATMLRCCKQDLRLSHYNIGNLLEANTETVFSMTKGARRIHNLAMIARIMNIDF